MKRIPWTLLLLGLAAVLLLGNESASAYKRKGSVSGWAKNTGLQAKTRLIMRLESDTDFKWVSASLKDPNQTMLIYPAISGEGTHVVYVLWTGLNVAPNWAVYYSVSWKLEEKNWVKRDAWFDPDSLPVPVPVLGFRVDVGGEFALINDYTEAIDYTDLKYVVYSPLDPLLPESTDSLALLMERIAEGTPLNTSGWLSLPDGSVPPNSQSPTLVQLSITEGEFLGAYFAQDFSGGTNPGRTLVQHEHQASEAIPTLTEWGLILLAALVMGCMAWVFVRQRRRAMVSL
ncbi:MAG: hypothetical protein ABIJ61_14580 [bacterium]